MRANHGLTLLEVLVTITIISIVTYLATTAFPLVREEEALVHARQVITSILRDAQTQALNEQRHPDCLARVGDDPSSAKKCSDVGLLLSGQEVIMFADTNDNNTHDQDDFRLQTITLPRPVTVTSRTSLLVEATPPNVTLWHDGTLISAGSSAYVNLQAGKRTASLVISSYAVVE